MCFPLTWLSFTYSGKHPLSLVCDYTPDDKDMAMIDAFMPLILLFSVGGLLVIPFIRFWLYKRHKIIEQSLEVLR